MRKFLLCSIFYVSISGLAQQSDSGISNGFNTYKKLFYTGMKDGISCYRIPAMVTAPNGDLLVAIDERIGSCGDLNNNRDINIVMRISHDNGKTWSGIKTIVDYPFGQSASDPSMITDHVTGEIFLFYNFMDLENEKGVYYHHFLKSPDDGMSWIGPVDITVAIADPSWKYDLKFITSGSGIQTRSGKLLHTLVTIEHGLYIFGSDDHGKSWYRIDRMLAPGDESKILELANETWIVNSRVNNAGMRYEHNSTDHGKTWETEQKPELIDPGCNAGILRYTYKNRYKKKNILIFSNAQTAKDPRENLGVRISYNGGRTWPDGRTIYTGSSAYSVLTILKNGDIGLLFEKDDYSENVFVSFSLKWLLSEN